MSDRQGEHPGRVVEVMKIVNLIENTKGAEGCVYEHGLSFYIETENHKILLDTGASGDFVDNAEKLGIDLTGIDILVLSHGHYDHSGGIMRFAGINSKAKIYMQKNALDPYYHVNSQMEKYIGVDTAIGDLPQVILLDGDYKIDDELEIFSGVLGRRAWPKGNLELMRRNDTEYIQDDFLHEQYLVISSGNEKVLLSGCAHNGILNILDKYKEKYKDEPDKVISGFHMMKKSGYTEEDVSIIREVAQNLKATKSKYYTCHCTGEEPYLIMKEIMGNQVSWVHSGERIE